MNADDCAARLVAWFASWGSALVAYSGGVDSTTVAAAAFRAMGRNMLAVQGLSPSVSERERHVAQVAASVIGMPFEQVHTGEMQVKSFVNNPSERCYHCKDELYACLQAMKNNRRFEVVVDGTNADDLGDPHRPGIRAANEHKVMSPLAELGHTKLQVRQIASLWGLPNAQKPASPCLSSRIPQGDLITPEKLRQVEMAEAFLVGIGCADVRVRHYGHLARVEVPIGDFPKVLERRSQITEYLKTLGFAFVTLDLAGIRSGSLNYAVVR